MWLHSCCLHVCECVHLNTWNASIQLNLFSEFMHRHTRSRTSSMQHKHMYTQYRQQYSKKKLKPANWIETKGKNEEEKKTFYKIDWLHVHVLFYSFIHSLARSLLLLIFFFCFCFLFLPFIFLFSYMHSIHCHSIQIPICMRVCAIWRNSKWVRSA